MKKLGLLLVMMLLSATAYCQGRWVLDSTTDDYTMEKNYILVHYEAKTIDAVFYPNDSSIKIIKDYNGSSYFDACWNAAIENDGRIDSKEVQLDCRLITNGQFEEFSFDDLRIYYRGYEDDGKIGTSGFYSYFFLNVSPEQLMKANYLTYRYFDSISGDVLTKRISLAGFTKCMNLIK